MPAEAGNFSSFGGAQGMDPFTLSLIIGAIGGGSSIFGSMMQADAANNAQQLSARQFEENRGDSKQKILAETLNSFLQGGLSQGQTGLAATQMNPYAIPMNENKANVMRSFGQGVQPNGTFNGQFDMSALSPDKMNDAASQFYTYLGAATPTIPLASSTPQAARTAQVGFTGKYNDLQKQILQYLYTLNTGGGSIQPEFNAANPNKNPIMNMGGGAYPPDIKVA